MLEFGRFGRPHGVRGEIRFHAHNPKSPLLVVGRRIRLGPSADETREFEVERLRFDPKGIVMKLSGIETREDAARLTHHRWFEPRAAFADLADDEVYMADLLGLRAVTVDGRELGEVVDVIEVGPHALLVVRGRGRRHLVPNVEAFVRRMDFEKREVVITPIDGLLDDGAAG